MRQVADPELKALRRVIEILSALPDKKTRERVLNFAADRLQQGEPPAAQATLPGLAVSP